jgi:hypothetical protein
LVNQGLQLAINFLEALAMNPNVTIHFAGTATGLVLGKALDSLPRLKFGNTDLAATSLQRSYKWQLKIRSGQVTIYLGSLLAAGGLRRFHCF